MLRRSTSFGPTCRLASSPEVGPGATVGTLKLGYPLLLYKDAVPTWLSLSHVVKVLCVGLGHDSPQSRATTLGPQQRPTHHMGESEAATCLEKVIYSKASTVSPDPHGRALDPWIYSPDLQGWSRTSTCASRTPRMGSRPPPPYGVRAAHNGVPSFQDRTYSGLEQDPGGGPVPTRVGTQTCLHTLQLLAQAEPCGLLHVT
jgi:hypothetical protein